MELQMRKPSRPNTCRIRDLIPRPEHVRTATLLSDGKNTKPQLLLGFTGITRMSLHVLKQCHGGEWGIRTPDRTFGPITV
jgi:hypothetical protein